MYSGCEILLILNVTKSDQNYATKLKKWRTIKFTIIVYFRNFHSIEKGQKGTKGGILTR